MTVLLTTNARNRFRQIYDYYKDLGKGKKGRQIRVKINKKILSLKDNPFSGQEEEDFKVLQLGHRYLIVENYKVIYRIEEAKIFITDIFDTRQDPSKKGPSYL